MRVVLLIAFLSAAATAGCNKPSPEDCHKLCLRYAELHYWAKFDEQSKDMSADDKKELRAEWEKRWKEEVSVETSHGRQNCVVGCRQGGDNEMVECVDKAETAAQAEKCLEDD